MAGPGRHGALRVVLAAVGVVAIAALLWTTGWTDVWANVRKIGLWFFVIVALNLVSQGAFVLGLQRVFDTPRPPGFARLYRIYLMGDAANYLVPGGGEAAKAHLLHRLGDSTAALAAVALHKHAELVAQSTFAVLGVGAALVSFRLPPHIAYAALGGTLLLLVALLLVTRALARGAFGPVLRRLARVRWLAGRLERLHGRAAEIDAHIANFHAAHPRRFLAAAALCFVGHCGGLLEAGIIMSLLAPSARWPSWLAVEAIPMVLNNLVLFIPGKLGGAEGIRTGVFVLVGLTAAQGAAYAILRRARELAWVVPGWALIARERFVDRRPELAPRLAQEPTDA